MNILPPKDFVCQVCKKPFKTQRALHSHIKAHDLLLAEYYTTYYPRVDLLTGSKIPFKNKNEYFLKDFCNYSNLENWILNEDEDEVKDYMIHLLRRRLKMKRQHYAPSSLELDTLEMPSIDLFKHKFGSYGAACQKVNTRPLFSSPLPHGFFQVNPALDDIEILIDTREKKPLNFPKSKIKKLDFGDYTAGGEDYSYTYIDRKSISDFEVTFGTKNIDRFRDELNRAQQFKSFVFVVVDGMREELAQKSYATKTGRKKVNLVFLWHRIRSLLHDYKGTVQVVFSGSRENSEKIIPKILYYGERIWDCDLEYFIRKKVKK